MDKITIYQQRNNLETYLWKRSEIINLPNNITNNSDLNFTINNTEYNWKYYNTNDFNSCKFEFEVGINIIIYTSTNHGIVETALNNLIEKIKSFRDGVVYIIIPKLVENYWGWYMNPEILLKTKLSEVSEIKNLRVIWEYPDKIFNNFYFSPKIAIQTFYKNNIFDSNSLFFNGNEVFKAHPKKYRFGLHISNLSDYVRNYLAQTFFDNKKENCWITICDNEFNKEFIKNKQFKNCVNFKSKFWDESVTKFGSMDFMSNDWYIEQFLEMTLHSDIEIVYETHTPMPHNRYFKKFTEKTLKLLYLGKPFIHTDPIAYQLLIKCGMKPCTSLYTDELIKIYNEFELSNSIGENEKYLPFLKDNINWLSDMDENEWKNRLNEANEITEYNYNKVRELIFETSLIDMIKDIENGIQ